MAVRRLGKNNTMEPRNVNVQQDVSIWKKIVKEIVFFVILIIISTMLGISTLGASQDYIYGNSGTNNTVVSIVFMDCFIGGSCTFLGFVPLIAALIKMRNVSGMAYKYVYAGNILLCSVAVDESLLVGGLRLIYFCILVVCALIGIILWCRVSMGQKYNKSSNNNNNNNSNNNSNNQIRSYRSYRKAQWF